MKIKQTMRYKRMKFVKGRFLYKTHSLLVGASLLIVSGVSMAENITFPSRSQDLANDSYWTVAEFSEKCCTLDLNVRRWDGSSWNVSTGSATNAQNFDWGVPLYAPANGVIASCWRNFPDDPSPGVNPANNNIFAGGNHVTIITDEGNAISMAHLQSGSIPANLCPVNAGNTQYPPTLDKQRAWRVAAYIEPANRPQVKEGQFIGRVGNSGRSSGPHLHMSMQPVTGTDVNNREALGEAIPMRFRHNWGHRYERSEQHTSSGWYRLRGGQFSGNPDCDVYQPNAPSCGFKTVHASPYLRRADASAGDVKKVDTLFISSNRAVTATIGASNNHLKLISWDLVGINSIARNGEIEAGAIKDVKIVEPAGNYVLAATRLMDDRLKMIAFRVLGNGTFVRVADYTAGKISAFEMAVTGGSNKKAVTAIRTQSGKLKLIAWDISVAANGTASITRLGQASAGNISSLSISRAKNFNGVFTAVRDDDNKLKVIPWEMSASGLSFTRGTAGEAGTIKTGIAVAPLAAGVATAVRDVDNNLRIITWAVNANGNIGIRHDTLAAGAVSEVQLLTAPHGSSNLTTVLRGSDGKLLLMGWAINADGSNLRRVGSSKAGGASAISADIVSRSYPGLDPRDMMLTSLRTESGDLKLITWDTNLVNP